ncbi:hypothetical protein Acr_00g0088120 [Actinidia rufa]|uniref:Uncharacterized protein n=1 Tax=Actinidia rufa TaxID=165716 RepID=A0A7J0DYS1_9ERIC|nr:hypothetical protein Acr_00g0088120 [Actinidia rufa]
MEVEATLPRKRNRFRVKKTTLEAVLRQCHTAIESLGNIGSANDGGDADGEGSPPPCRDKDTDEVREIFLNFERLGADCASCVALLGMFLFGLGLID